MGRHSEYTEKVALQLCELIAGGLALKDVCEIEGMPARTTAYKWLADNEDFAIMYTRAREERAELIADEVITIADTEPDPHKARVRIDARKWWAAKVNPKKYGDKMQVGGDADNPIKHAVELTKIERVIVDPADQDGKGVPPPSR